MKPAPVCFANDDIVQAWYYAGQSSDLRPGGLMARTIAGMELVVYRGLSGKLQALAAHCCHMGAHLSTGKVVGERVRCALHHRLHGDETGSMDRRNGHGGDCPRQQSFPVEERYGSIFVFSGPEALFPPPAFKGIADGEIATLPSRDVLIDCPWHAIAANGFDQEHFSTVHLRRLKEPPELTQPAPHCLRLSYLSGVMGTAIADRAMKWISRDAIRATITCWGGPIILVESDLGRVRSALILSFQPKDGIAHLNAIFCVRRSGLRLWDGLRLRVARWLFLAFFERDIAILDGMRFQARVDPRDAPVLHRALEFLQALPRMPKGGGEIASKATNGDPSLRGDFEREESEAFAEV